MRRHAPVRAVSVFLFPAIDPEYSIPDYLIYPARFILEVGRGTQHLPAY